MGGLLKLHHVPDGQHVRYVGWCPGGAFGLTENGNLVWQADWGYMTNIEIDGTKLLLAGRPADLETGVLLSPKPVA